MNYNRYSSRPSARRRGISMYLFIGSLPVIMGITGMVVDLTNLYTRRAVASRASDAAALAGSLAAKADPTDATKSNDSEIIAQAKYYAGLNGYGTDEVTVDPHVGGQIAKVSVTVARNERVFFTPVLEFLLGANPLYARKVSASATAERFVAAKLPLGGNYGTTTGASNPSAFGPYAKHSYGDPYSVKYYDDGTLNDEAHVSHNLGVGWDNSSHYNPNGQTYSLTLDAKKYANSNGDVNVQLYDPDGHISNDGKSLDEYHKDYAGPTQPAIPEATTKYTLFKVQPDGSLKEMKSVTYGDDASVDAANLVSQGKDPWITPDGFKISLGSDGYGEYKIRVQTIDGSSENGYNLRAGPAYAPGTTETQWNNMYGDKGGTDPSNILVPILSDDKLQMNFTTSSQVKVQMAYIDASVAGKQVTINKFDTDVGSSAISYSYMDKNGVSHDIPGTNLLDTRNDYWSQNIVNVPSDFQGGYWYASYKAGQNDTSSWSISYPGAGDSVALVK